MSSLGPTLKKIRIGRFSLFPFIYFLDKKSKRALDEYIQDQKIGRFSQMGNLSDFMTDKLVILFPENLIKFCQDFQLLREVA